MCLGLRIFDDTYIDKFDFDLFQVSVWYNKEEDFRRVSRLVHILKKTGKRFIIHPTSLYLSETRSEVRKYYLDTLRGYAQITDLGLIIHDETLPKRGRLAGDWEDAYKSALAQLEPMCNISIENASDSTDVFWFWQSFAHSITFDIGHFVAAGMDCLKVIDSLNEEMLLKLDYIHLHRNNGKKESGMTDHWPLTEDCVELKALKRLLKLKPEAKVILEVDGEAGIKKSLEILSRFK